MAFDIYEFVFHDILKYSPSSSALTGDLQHDVVFGLLIPTVFISFVLYFSVRNVFGAGHAMIGNLAAITGLGVIITLGWVPLIAGFGSFVFVAMLALLFVGAFYRRLVPDGAEMKLRKGARWAGSMVDVGSPVIPPKQRRALGVKLRRCESEYNSAVIAIKSYEDKGDNKGQGLYVNTGESQIERTTDIERHTKMKDNAVEKAVQIIEYFQKGERIDVLKSYVKEGGDFYKEVNEIFSAQRAVEDKYDK